MELIIILAIMGITLAIAGRKAGKMRTIKVIWSDQRKINRIYKWLGITADFSGWIYRGGERIGYKTNWKRYLVFNFEA